jgi:hypothetical protein
LHFLPQGDAHQKEMTIKTHQHKLKYPLCAIICSAAWSGCLHPQANEIRQYMQSDSTYNQLPPGPQRVDAIFDHATSITGSKEQAVELLGSLAVHQGIRLKHPFNTGLTADGPLSCNDKTGHFFTRTMWQFQDYNRLIPVAGTFSFLWEVCGEVKSWFSTGAGFDMKDVWANRLGKEFARQLHENPNRESQPIMPSDVISQAPDFRPKSVPPHAPPECDQ